MKGKKSIMKVKNRNSAMKNKDPGKPKKIIKLIRATRNNFGHKKFKPCISVTKRVLKRRTIESTNKKEFEDKIAWLMNIAKPAKFKTL
jgi:hypothetical protein